MYVRTYLYFFQIFYTNLYQLYKKKTICTNGKLQVNIIIYEYKYVYVFKNFK